MRFDGVLGSLSSIETIGTLRVIPEAALQFLLDRGLIEVRDIVQGALRFEDVSHRNQSFKVTCDTRPGYLLKSVCEGESMGPIIREARFYQDAQDTGPYADLRPFVPGLHLWDAEEGALVLQLHADAPTASDFATAATHGIPLSIEAPLGRALATCHRLPAQQADPPIGPLGANEPPWALRLGDPPPSVLRDVEEEQLEILRLIHREPDICERLEHFADTWARTGLAHGDIRWENVLVRLDSTGTSATGVILVDWELSGPGDARWDVGSVFQAYLAHYLVTVVEAGKDDAPGAICESFASHVTVVQRAVGSFWDSYLEAAGLPGVSTATFRERAVMYSGARLLQAAFEWAALEWSVAIHLLQLGVNVLRRPLEAERVLLGLRTGS